MKSPKHILEGGTHVMTNAQLGKTDGMLIGVQYLRARRPNMRGTIWGIVGGHGGDVYWVKHHDGGEAAYCFTELELVAPDENLAQPTPTTQGDTHEN